MNETHELNSIYTSEWFAKRYLILWRAAVMCGVLRHLFHPKTYLDAGCAIGDLVEDMLLAGVDSLGIEGSNSVTPYVRVKDRVLILDLRFPIDLPKCDLCTCFEVAEHIEPWGTNTFLDNLCRFSDLLVMSISTFQGGKNHVNLQPRSWWDKKMQDRGYSVDDKAIEDIRHGIFQHKHREEIRWWYERLVVYERNHV